MKQNGTEDKNKQWIKISLDNEKMQHDLTLVNNILISFIIYG